MKKRYIVMDYLTRHIYCETPSEWIKDNPMVSYFFETINDAEIFISKQKLGAYIIQEVYINIK